MTIEIECDVEKPALIQPKKRMNGKMCSQAATHVDHIIVLQGVSNLQSGKMNSLADAVGVIEHHKNMENGFPRNNGIKSHAIMDLPVIPDDDEKSEPSPTHADDNKYIVERPQTLSKNGLHQTNHNIHSSREMVDLSPIYENSSDAYSSHDDIQVDVQGDKLRNDNLNAEDVNESSLMTPNSLSHSETSLETGLIAETKSGKKKKKKVNISDQNEDLIEIESSALKCDSEISSPDKSLMSNCTDGYLTMTGTIKRGKKKGHNVDVKLNISREELEILEAAIVAKEINKTQQWFRCTPTVGFHVVVWTLLCMPVIFFISALYSFYIGTITWYNIFTYISECKNVWKRIFISPFVILLYPFLIIIFTVGLGFYSAIIQLTFCASSWWKEVCDLEKGFYGWLCGVLHLSDCSPYEVVILTDLKAVETTDMRGHSSTEDLSI